MFHLIFISAMFFIGSVNSEAGTPANCVPVREAKANIKVTRLYWQQKNGSYDLKRETVCEMQKTMGVLPGVAGGCTYPVLADCQVQMDGNPHRVKVSGQIYHNDDLGQNTKHFTAGYHLNRDGVTPTGEAASGSIYTTDLSLKNISLSVQSKLDSPSRGTVVRDGITISVDFEDTNAP